MGKKIIDLTGKRFGYLLVKEQAGKDKHGHTLWKCDCDCGNKDYIVSGDRLTRNITTSCGCKQKKQFDKEIQKLIGKKVNRLTVIERAQNYVSPKGKSHTMLKCKCDCGEIVVLDKYFVTKGIVKSCGCLQKEVASKMSKKHGMHGTHIYIVWDDMIGRCYRKSNPRYNNYGERGIIVCDEWRQFEQFYEHVSKLPNYNKKGYTLDRIDSDGNYEPNNVRWADNETQANNKTSNHYVTYDGKTQTVTQWAREKGLKPSTLINRLDTLHWNVEKALNTPVK